MEMKEKSPGWLKIFFLDPGLLCCVFVFCMIGFLVFLWGGIHTLNYTVPVQSQLQVIEGTVEKYELGGGKNKAYCELTLEEGGTYYLNDDIVFDLNFGQSFRPLLDLREGYFVELWIDLDYKEHFPNQIYAINVEGEEYLTYEQSRTFLEAKYGKGAADALKIAAIFWLIDLFVSISVAVQLIYKKR